MRDCPVVGKGRRAMSRSSLDSVMDNCYPQTLAVTGINDAEWSEDKEQLLVAGLWMHQVHQ